MCTLNTLYRNTNLQELNVKNLNNSKIKNILFFSPGRYYSNDYYV